MQFSSKFVITVTVRIDARLRHELSRYETYELNGIVIGGSSCHRSLIHERSNTTCEYDFGALPMVLALMGERRLENLMAAKWSGTGWLSINLTVASLMH